MLVFYSTPSYVYHSLKKKKNKTKHKCISHNGVLLQGIDRV